MGKRPFPFIHSCFEVFHNQGDVFHAMARTFSTCTDIRAGMAAERIGAGRHWSPEHFNP
jgi:hypothetical protein